MDSVVRKENLNNREGQPDWFSISRDNLNNREGQPDGFSISRENLNNREWQPGEFSISRKDYITEKVDSVVSRDNLKTERGNQI